MQAWDEFVKQQAKEFGLQTVERWLLPIKTLRFDACNIYLEAPDSFSLLWFEEHIRPKIKNFYNPNGSIIKVHISVKGEKKPVNQPSVEKAKNKKAVETTSPKISFEEIDYSKTLENFVAVEDSIIAIKLLEELVQQMKKKANKEIVNPENFINPMYIYGPDGVGKTHLLYAVAAELKKLRYQVLYAKADLFTEHVVRAIRSQEMTFFREVYRKADVLLIDDVHTLAKKSATQEEFFHTFNTLHIANKPIILTSNVSPQHLQFIEPRLVSRFEWGIAIPLAQLKKRELVDLLERRAREEKFPLSLPTCEFIAETFPLNTKSALRAQDTLILRSHLDKGKGAPLNISVAATKLLLKDLIEKEKDQAVNADKILQVVAEYYGIKVEDILGKSQSRECVIPRQISMYFCRRILNTPYMKIGDLFARDHSTVMSAIRQVEKQLTSDTSEMRGVIATLKLKLQRN